MLGCLVLNNFLPWLLMVGVVGVLMGVPISVDNGRLFGGIHVNIQMLFK
jgi:hypothetical protein